MENENYDYERLRNDLINYFGTATSFSPVAFMDVIKVEHASNNELISIAYSNNFDLNDYKVKGLYYEK